jgi:hypothetical protein
LQRLLALKGRHGSLHRGVLGTVLTPGHLAHQQTGTLSALFI